MLTNRNTLAMVVCLLSSLTAGAHSQPPVTRAGTMAPLPRDLEIQLALNSLPAHLRDNATVYVLNPAKGSTSPAKVRMASTRSSLVPATMR